MSACGFRVGPHGRPKFHIPTATLQALYEQSRLTPVEIGELYGISLTVVSRRLVAVGIPRRARGGASYAANVRRIDRSPELMREV